MTTILLPDVIYTSSEVLTKHAVIVDGSRISDVLPMAELPEAHSASALRVDLTGFQVAPGFIDLQVNGGGDKLFNREPTAETVKRIVAAHRRYGTTSMLPTFITGSSGDMGRAADAVRECHEEGLNGAVLGLHYEGPFISSKKAGVHNPNFIRESIDANFFESLAKLQDTALLMMTIAPEVLSAADIDELIVRGVHLAVGHTNSDSKTCREALNRGVKGATHLFNAMSPLSSRELGAVGTLLLADDTWVDIIADGRHVSYDTIKLALRAKPTGKCFFVTDAMPPVGGEDLQFDLPPYRVVSKDGACYTEAGVLAGSALDMASAVRNGVHGVGIELAEALRMASLYPAQFLGIDHVVGRIRAGWRADLVIFDDLLGVIATMLAGDLERYT
ncbi:MAG: N-acetylglucosamine-6-phosphate deacetylase [Pseudonocardiaceae bacterium]